MPAQVPSYSQYKQDAYVLDNYFWGVHNGTFIELGAFDGLRMSNSKLFEDTLGWTGMLVEAGRTMYPLAVNNRPRSHVVQAVCGQRWSKDGIKFTTFHGSTIEGGVSYANERNADKADELFKGFNMHSTVNIHPLVTMAALTERFSCGTKFHVDFMSLDVEGFELNVMQGWDWDRVTIGVLVIETKWLSKDTQETLDSLLARRGQLERGVTTMTGDTFYISPHGEERRRKKPDGVRMPNLVTPYHTHTWSYKFGPAIRGAKTKKREKTLCPGGCCFKEVLSHPQGPCA